MIAEVGTEIPSLQVQVTREQIAEYAEAGGDRNPIHLDDDYARSVGLPGVIAHGLLDMAFLARLVTDFAGDPRRLRVLRCRFSGMVQPGDTLTCRGRVTGVTPDAVELELWAEKQDGERVLGKGFARVARA